MMWGYGWDMGWSWLVALFGLLMLAGIVLLVVLLVRLFGGAGSHGGGSGVAGPTPGMSRARQILDERYAAGEITAEQYREQIQVLGENT
jgi:putative membrane protein